MRSKMTINTSNIKINGGLSKERPRPMVPKHYNQRRTTVLSIIAACIVATLTEESSAFTLSHSGRGSSTPIISSSSKSLLSQQWFGKASIAASRFRPLSASTNDADSEIEMLRAAAAKARASAQKIREETAALEKELGKEVTAFQKKSSEGASQPQMKQMTREEIISLLGPGGANQGLFEGIPSAQSTALDDLVQSGDLALWGSVRRNADSGIGNGLRTYPVSLSFLETKTGGKVTAKSLGVEDGSDMGEVTLEDFQYSTIAITAGASVAAVAALAFLPENVGATVCYLVAAIPVGWVAIGSTSPGLLALAITTVKGRAGKGEDTIARNDRICRHEAGHFLCGYACGLPVRTYSTGDDNDEGGVPRVEFHQPNADSKNEFSAKDVAALSVVAMGGSVAEALAFGDAKGGRNDLLQLDAIFRRSSEFVGAEKQKDATRWGALRAYEIIVKNGDVLDGLVEAFREKKGIEECIAIMEGQ